MKGAVKSICKVCLIRFAVKGETDCKRCRDLPKRRVREKTAKPRG